MNLLQLELALLDRPSNLVMKISPTTCRLMIPTALIMYQHHCEIACHLPLGKNTIPSRMCRARSIPGHPRKMVMQGAMKEKSWLCDISVASAMAARSRQFNAF